MERKNYPVQKERFVKRIDLIDLDRHVLNTEVFHSLFTQIAHEKTLIQPSELDEVKAEIESRGKSAHSDQILLNALIKRYAVNVSSGEIPELTPEEELNAVFARMLEVCDDPDIRDSLFMPDAREYVEALQSTGSFERGEAMFFTYGTQPLQLLKLLCIGARDSQYLITDDPNKGKFIAESRQGSGKSAYYEFTSMHGMRIRADKVRLLDDKASSYRDLPSKKEGATGRWKLPQPDGSEGGIKIMLSQIGTVPENVKEVTTFPRVKSIGDRAIRKALEELSRK